jgi:drug/metabolite transporter (DMT)-like permease
MNASSHPPRPARWKVLLAFACVYLIWGSTYLAIRWAIEDIPPFLMAGMRNLSAGVALSVWALAHGARWPRGAEWRSAALIGGLMLLGGNGSVTWSEQRIPSGLAALLVSFVPLWMALLQGIGGGPKPGRRAWAGVFIGLLGIAILVGPESLAGGGRADLLAAGVLVCGSLAWASGSLIGRRHPTSPSPLLGAGLQMVAGGALLLVAGTLAGEPARFDPALVHPRAWLAMGYLAVFGSIVGFTAYVWLMRVSSPSRAATYAFVNPVVAVLLGWALAGEPLGARTLMAAAVIVGAVALIVLAPRRAPAAAPAPNPSDEPPA